MTDVEIEFDSKIQGIGNKGKSRGCNLSLYTNEQDIGRHIVGHFHFVDTAPDSAEYLNRKKQHLLSKRIEYINNQRTLCAQNKLSIHARKNGLPEEQALTIENLNSYFAIWAKLDNINSQDLDYNSHQLQLQLLKDIEAKLQMISIDVHTPYTLRKKEGVRETYSKTEYALDEELERVVHKDNIVTYKTIKIEYVNAKKLLESQSDKTTHRNLYIQSLTIPKFIIEAVIEDIDEGYTKNALSQLDKRVDAYIKDPQALMKRKSK